MREQIGPDTGASRETFRNGATVTLRPLHANDGEALADFYAAVPSEDNFYYAPHCLTPQEAARKAARAGSPGFVCLVIEADGKAIVGYAWYRWKDGDRASVFGVCVDRRLQGAGAGRLLISRLSETARTIGPLYMSLTVQKSNERALALYRGAGFRIVREQLRGSDGEPEYYMELKVRTDDNES
jgi:ribosomal protein S18 acetylase RimI-like enzyme